MTIDDYIYEETERAWIKGRRLDKLFFSCQSKNCCLKNKDDQTGGNKVDIDTLVKRINELARKNKAEGLTEDEKLERAQLRETYLQNIRNNFRQQLESIEIVDK